MSKAVKFAVCVLVMSVLLIHGLVSAESKKEKYRIGLVVPLSGPVAYIGEAMKNSLILAKEQIGTTSRFDYDLIIEDDQLDLKLDATIGNKFINVDKVDAIITLGGGKVISPMAKKSKTLHYSVAVMEYIADGPTNFLHWAPSKVLNGRLAEEMKKRGIKKYGVFYETTYEGFKIYRDDLKAAADKLGMEMVSDESFPMDATDFRAQIARVKGKGADIYVYYCQTPAMEILTKQLREAGDNTPLTAVESFELTKEKDLFEGYWFVSSPHPTNDFVDAYKKRFGYEPAVAGPNTYDILMLVNHAIINTGSIKKPTSEQIARELLKIKNFPGSLGNLTIVEPGITMSDVDMKIIKNGETVKMEP
ncbi:MAG: ABC transporter substrate-binding protein [Nitrospirota bacterium]